MDIIIRPAEHVEELFGKRPLLIYGDVSSGSIVLYSTEQLPGYRAEGDVYARRIRLDDPLIEKTTPVLTNGNAYVYPRKTVVMRPPTFAPEESIEHEPDDELKELFRVQGSFGYIPSAATMNHFYPNTETGLATLPSDISLSHEGSHVVSVNEMRGLLPQYLGLVSEDITDNDTREDALFEAVAFFGEGRYLDRFHPSWRSWYEEHRAKDQHPEYIEADRLVRQEPQKVDELVSRIRGISLRGHL